MMIVELPDVLDLRAASPLAATILGARGRQLTIDASKVQKVGAQCIQVLLSARTTWLADNASLTISNPSETFIETIETLGIPLTRLSEQEPSK